MSRIIIYIFLFVIIGLLESMFAFAMFLTAEDSFRGILTIILFVMGGGFLGYWIDRKRASKKQAILPLLILFIPSLVFCFAFFQFYPGPYDQMELEVLYPLLAFPFLYVYEVIIYLICRNLQKKLTYLQLASLIAGISIILIIILGVFNFYQLERVVYILTNPFFLLLFLVVTILTFLKL